MRPEALNAWVTLFRDVVMVVLATFILSYETVIISSPNPVLIGAGLSLLGVPAALRVDSARRKQQKENGNGDDDGRWSHLP